MLAQKAHAHTMQNTAVNFTHLLSSQPVVVVNSFTTLSTPDTYSIKAMECDCVDHVPFNPSVAPHEMLGFRHGSCWQFVMVISYNIRLYSATSHYRD